MAPVARALRDAAMEPQDLNEVILVGGATRMHAFRAAVARMFRRIPASHIDPDRVVAHGAAIQAALAARDEALDDVVLTDVCPHSLGIEVHNHSDDSGDRGYFLPIIERNSVIPNSIVKTVTTVQDRQTQIVARVFQGESRYAHDNVYLGELTVRVPKAPAGREPVDVRFSYDANGLLQVDVTVRSTQEQISRVIDNSAGTLSESDKQAAIKRLQGLKIHPRDDEYHRLLMARGERLFAELLGQVRDRVGMAIASFESVLERQDRREIGLAAKEFEEFLDACEALL